VQRTLQPCQFPVGYRVMSLFIGYEILFVCRLSTFLHFTIRIQILWKSWNGADVRIIYNTITFKFIICLEVGCRAADSCRTNGDVQPALNTKQVVFPRLVITHETQNQCGVTSYYLKLPYLCSANSLRSNIYSNFCVAEFYPMNLEPLQLK
jgi:hypothetical protein